MKLLEIALVFLVGILGFAFGTAFDFMNFQQKEREIAHNQKMDNRQLLLQEGQIAVALFPYLSGNDPYTRQLAISTIEGSLLTIGSSLLRPFTSPNDQINISEQEQAQAINALAGQRATLTRHLFDVSFNTRSNAYNSILIGWSSDPLMVSKLLETAISFRGRSNWPVDENGDVNEWLYKTGVLNTMRILVGMSGDALLSEKQKICSFISTESAGRPQTRNAGDRVEAKIGGC